MKNNTIVCSLLAILAIAATGCSTIDNYTAGSNAGKKTAKSLEHVSDMLLEADTHVLDTVTALEDLVENPAADLRPQYSSFTKSLSSLEKSAEKIGDAADKMKEKGNEYFPEWKSNLSEIQNDKLRRQMEKRNGKVLDQFQDIVEDFGKLKDDYKPFIAQLSDVRTALDNDLTAGGVDLVSDLADDIIDDSEDIREYLEEMSAAFGDFAEKLSPILEQTAS